MPCYHEWGTDEAMERVIEYDISICDSGPVEFLGMITVVLKAEGFKSIS